MGRANTLVFVGLVLVMSAAPASAESVDRTSSRVFLSDAIALDRTLIIHRTERQAAANAFVNQIAPTCPDALVNDPIVGGTQAQGRTFETLDLEANIELNLAALDPVRSRATALVHELANLRWSRPKISRAVAAYRAALSAVLALEPPNFCADASASAANQFASAPSEASQFVQGFMAVPRSAHGGLVQIAEMMRPLLATNQQTSLTRLKNLQARQEKLSSLEPAVERLALLVLGK